MSASDWITLIILGGLLGAIGQMLRVVVGLKKLRDKAAETKTSFVETFVASELVLSLMIGFAAGALAGIAAHATQDTAVEANRLDLDDIRAKFLFGIMAAGYAGTDFIEGIAKKYLPG